MKKTKRLRELFKGDKLIKIAGAHNGLTAKLVEEAGFDGVWASGLEISTSHALPDANILTMADFLHASESMADAVALPVVADCDTGFGNSNNVIHMVKKYEAANIAAVCIEDKKFPKVNSLLSGSRQELSPIAEFVGKITAAKSVQACEDFTVIARVEALIAGWGEAEALLRAQKYAQAGADAILIHSKSKTPDEIISFAGKWDRKVPLIIVPTTYPSIMTDFTEEELLGLGIKMVIFANHGLRASIKAVKDVLAEIKASGGIHTIEEKISDLNEVFKLQGMFDMREQEKKYLKSEHEDVAVIIPAAGEPAGQESIKPLLRDRPLCMIDIKGKTLLQRGLETLRKIGINNINIIVGYKKEKIIDGCAQSNVNLINNDEFANKHILHSLMLAQGKMNDRVLIVYSDILVDAELINKALSSRADIVVVGDNAYKRYGNRNRKLDLIKVSEPLVIGKREIAANELLAIKRIGDDLDERSADFEFTGIVYLSRQGVNMLKDLYNEKKAELEGTDKRFHTAVSFDQASLADMLQEAVENGLPVKVLPVSRGWMEIHEFEDYIFACKKIKGEEC